MRSAFNRLPPASKGARIARASASADLHSRNLGTLIRLEPISPRGRRWWRRHVGNLGEGMIDCDHRCGIAILLGALDAGLSVQDVETGKIARGVPDVVHP